MVIPVGIRLGRYEIRSPLGAGGMGEVYLAWDGQLDRTVALKILPPDVASDEDRMRRFVQEAKAASGLNHPNIITIYEIGESDSSHFIVTEFIDGVTLRDHMTHTQMKLGEILDIAIQVASALGAAHAVGIIHRDIKPENIMVRRDGYVKVLDFGLAKLGHHLGSPVDDDAPTRTLIKTEPGVVMGTVGYMSPEQARGAAVSAQTDIWGLGVVLYEMITGHLPFAGATSGELLASLFSDKEPPPLARYRREVPAELEWIAQKALAKNTEERYQTIKDLALDLKKAKRDSEFEAKLERSVPPELRGSGTSVSLPPAASESVAEPSARPTLHVKRLTRALSSQKSGTVLIALLLIIAAVAYFYLARSNQTAIDSVAILPFVNSSADPNTEYLADGITESLINSLSQVPGLKVIARSSVFRYKTGGADPQKVGRELGVQAVLTGRIMQRGDGLSVSVELMDVRDNSHLWGEQYNRRMTDLLAIQGEISREISEKLRLRLTSEEKRQVAKNYTGNTEAYQLYLKGRYFWYKRTPEDVKKSREYFQRAIDLDPSYVPAYSGLADFYGYAAARGLLPPDEAWPKAEAAAMKALEIDESHADAHNALAAHRLYYRRDWPASEREFKRAIELNPNYAEVRFHYAICLMLFDRADEAIAEIKRVQGLDPLSPRPYMNLGRIFYQTRRYDEAIEQFLKALEFDQNDARIRAYLGDVYEQKGMYAEAVAEWRKAMILSGDEELAAILDRAYKESDFKKAVQSVSQKGLERLNEKAKRGEYVPAMEFVELYARLGDKEQAIAWLERAYEERNRLIFEIKLEPIFDGLRPDPRFQDLLRRIGLTL